MSQGQSESVGGVTSGAYYLALQLAALLSFVWRNPYELYKKRICKEVWEQKIWKEVYVEQTKSC